MKGASRDGVLSLPSWESLSGKDLPPSFQFSQSSLQDFVECRRRFQLRYIWDLAWPAIESQPIMQSEQRMRRGALFHRLVHQHLSGVPLERLSSLIPRHDKEDVVAHWWDNYTRQFSDAEGFNRLSGLTGLSDRFHEVILSAPIGEHRLLAKYDLILIGVDGRAIIVDWKTSSKLPKRQWLAERLQTRVYPYILARSGRVLTGDYEIQPGDITMVYWYANIPDQPQQFSYDTKSYQADNSYLESLVDTIYRLGADEFPLTADDKRCAYCVYRSLCNRGIQAGALENRDSGAVGAEEFDTAIDFEQIAEIEF